MSPFIKNKDLWAHRLTVVCLQETAFLDFIFISLLQGRGMSVITKKVDALFAEWDKKYSPGCAVGIIRDGKLVYGRGYGMANLEYCIPLSTDSVFDIGSVAKQFTATCILILAIRKKLSLNDKIRKHMPELPFCTSKK